MKEKFDKLLNWGVGTFQIVMKNKLVSIGCFLIPGLFHTFNPVGSLDWDTMMLSLLLMLYAVLSIIFLLTNKNEKIGESQKMASDMVKDYFVDQKNKAVMTQDMLATKKNGERTETADDRIIKYVENAAAETKKGPKPSDIVLLVIYILLLALAVCMFIWRSFFVGFVQIVYGLLLIADGLSSLVTLAAAYRSGVPIRDKIASLVLSIFTVATGVLFILLPSDTAAISYRISGSLLIIKAVGEFIVMIRNREVLSSIKGSLREIKEQEK